MTREEDTALVQFHLLRCIIPGSLRRLIRCIGGGFRFPPPPMSVKERKFLGRQVEGYMRYRMRIMLVVCTFFSSLCIGAAKNVVTNGVKAAAEQGDVAAQYRYAEMLRDGRGVAKNLHEAVVWTRKAADGGLAAAQCQMGLFYMNGLGVDHDEDKAVEWLNKAATQNHAQAQYNLGIYYAKFSDKEAVRLAVKWLNEAAKQDYADAQFNLAQLYLNPHHPASCNPTAGRRAISLLRRAAAQGHTGAKVKLKELGVET